MKLISDLNKLVEETQNKEEAKELIEDAGMLLTDDELDWVTGGGKAGAASKAGAAGKAGKASKRII